MRDAYVASGHAFISYVREDAQAVDKLQRVLEAAGVRVWRDTADLWPGQDWRARIKRAIVADALVFIPCFSRSSVGRKKTYQNEELRLAVEQARQRQPGDSWLIPVRLDDCAIPDWDVGCGQTMASIQCADLFGDHEAEGIARLVKVVLGILNRPDSGAGTEGWPSAPVGGWDLDAPSIPIGEDGYADPTVDMVLKSGLSVPPGKGYHGRPLSEVAIRELCASLDKSPLASTLVMLTGLTAVGLNGFRRRGHPNTSAAASLTWEIVHGNISPFQLSVSVEAPGQYGRPDISEFEITVTAVSRFTAWLRGGLAPEPPPPGSRRRFEIAEWVSLLDAVLFSLTEPLVVAAIAKLANSGPSLVFPPRMVHLISEHKLAEFLPGWLQPIPGAIGTCESHLQADPRLDLARQADRIEQIDRWLQQITQDASLTGMERLARPLLPQQ